MALYITDKGVTYSWHVGETLPKIKGRVVTFQADGDELGVLLRGLGYDEPIPGEYVTVVTHEVRDLSTLRRPGSARDRDEEE